MIEDVIDMVEPPHACAMSAIIITMVGKVLTGLALRICRYC
jgi:hypothetical protein